MAEHIDNNRINSDPRYRFQYLSKFLDFTENDIHYLNALAPIITPLIPVLVDTVYRKLFSYDITKRYFTLRNQGFEDFGEIKDNNLTLDSARMIFQKDMLSIYLKRILTESEWSDTFLQYLSQVGEVHAKKNDISLSIDYIHVNVLFGYLEHHIIASLWNSGNIDDQTKHKMVTAVNKLCWILNDFFTRHYISLTKEKLSTDLTKIESTHCCLLN